MFHGLELTKVREAHSKIAILPFWCPLMAWTKAPTHACWYQYLSFILLTWDIPTHISARAAPSCIYMAAKSANFVILHTFPESPMYKYAKTADTKKSQNHDQPTIITCSNSCGKTLFECARENLSPTSHNSNYGSPGLSRFSAVFTACYPLIVWSCWDG